MKKCFLALACCIAGGSAAAVFAQGAEDLEAKIINQGQWLLAFKVPPKLLVTNGYDVIYDYNILLKLSDAVYAANFAQTNTKPAYWDEKFQTGTYKIDCNKSEFYFIGYKFRDGSWIDGKPGKIWKFNKRSQEFFGNFCSQADSLIAAKEAAKEAAISATMPPPATLANEPPPLTPAAPPAPKAVTRPAPKAATKPAQTRAADRSTAKTQRVYSAEGITVTCVTEQGQTICS